MEGSIFPHYFLGTYLKNFLRTIFEIKNILLIEFWPGLANLLGMSEINQGFEKVRFELM